jgi:hypothetical protein
MVRLVKAVGAKAQKYLSSHAKQDFAYCPFFMWNAQNLLIGLQKITFRITKNALPRY